MSPGVGHLEGRLAKGKGRRSVDPPSFLNVRRNEEEYEVRDCKGSHSESTSRDVRAEVTC